MRRCHRAGRRILQIAAVRSIHAQLDDRGRGLRTPQRSASASVPRLQTIQARYAPVGVARRPLNRLVTKRHAVPSREVPRSRRRGWRYVRPHFYTVPPCGGLSGSSAAPSFSAPGAGAGASSSALHPAPAAAAAAPRATAAPAAAASASQDRGRRRRRLHHRGSTAAISTPRSPGPRGTEQPASQPASQPPPTSRQPAAASASRQASQPAASYQPPSAPPSRGAMDVRARP